MGKTTKTIIICISAVVLMVAVAFIIFGMGHYEERRLSNAYNLLNNEDYTSAIAEFDKLIEKNNKNIEAYAGKAMAQIVSGDESGASDTIGEMINNCDDEKYWPDENNGHFIDENIATEFEGNKKEQEQNISNATNNSDDNESNNNQGNDNKKGPESEPTISAPWGTAETLRAEFEWKCIYNIKHSMSEQNEIEFNIIEQDGMNAKYNIYSRPPMPTTDCPGGKYDKAMEIVLYPGVNNGTVRYITEGTELTLLNSILYEKPIVIKKNHLITNISAVTYDRLFIPSERLNLTYELERLPLDKPTYSHNSGNYSSKFSLSLSNPNKDGIIYYTTDGGEPTTESKQYSGRISIGEGTTNIKAKIIDSENDISSETIDLSYNVEIPKKKYYISGSASGTCEKCGGKYMNPAHSNSVLCTKCGWCKKFASNDGRYVDISDVEFFFTRDRDDVVDTDLPYKEWR